MKKLTALMLALVLALSLFAACGEDQQSEPESSEVVSSMVDASGEDSSLEGEDAQPGEAQIYSGRIGDVMKTIFFDFTVESAQYVESYGEYKPASGMVLVDVVISITNTQDYDMPMFNQDFIIQWGEGAQDFSYGHEMSYELEGVMPYESHIPVGESAKHHLLFEVPEGEKDLSVAFLELFNDETTGDIFFVYFNL